MRTELIDLTAAPDAGDDELLMTRLSGVPAPAVDGPPTLRLAMEGPHGAVYRLIEVSSLVEAVRVMETLHDAGWRVGGRSRDAARKPVTRMVRSAVS